MAAAVAGAARPAAVSPHTIALRRYGHLRAMKAGEEWRMKYLVKTSIETVAF